MGRLALDSDPELSHLCSSSAASLMGETFNRASTALSHQPVRAERSRSPELTQPIQPVVPVV